MADKDVQINIHVTESVRHAFKSACLKLHTTMSTVLRDTVKETIVRASLTPDAMRQAEENHDA